MELKAIMWRIANPEKDTPDDMLKGKPIRLGGKVYQPGMLPKKVVDPLAGLDDLGVPPAQAVAAEPLVVSGTADDLLTPSEAPAATAAPVVSGSADDLLKPPVENSGKPM